MANRPPNELQVRVQYFECDPMGVLHHARYLEYFEKGRTELLRRSGLSYRDMERSHQHLVVARAECKFKKPAFYDDLLTLTTELVRATRARLDHHYELRRGDQLLCVGRTTLACVDDSGQLISVPAHLIHGVS